MNDQDKTKEQLIAELVALRREVENSDRLASILATVVENLPNPVVVTGLDGRIIYVNKSTEQFYGYSYEELIGKSPEIFNAESNAHSIQKEIIDSMRRSEIWSGDIMQQRKDGSTYLGELDVFPVKKAYGATLAWASVQRNITRQKQEEMILREHAHFLQNLIDNIPNPIFYIGVNGLYKGCNSAFEKHVGFSKQQIIRKSVYDLHPQELADKYNELDLALLEKPGVQVLEGEYQNSDGERRHIIINKATYNDARGNLAGIVGVFLDITERKRVEEALRKSENEYRTIFENTGTATVIVDEDMVLSLVNRETENLFGYLKEDLEGKKFTEFIYHEELDRVTGYHQLRKTDPDKVPSSYETKVVDRLGNVKNVLLTVAMIPGTRRRVASFLNITEIKRFQEVMARFEQLNLIGQMAAGIGHEIRNPMTTARGFLQLLSKKDCENYKAYLTTIIEELDRANSIINEFLTLSKTTGVNLENQDLNSIVKTLYPLIQADATLAEKYVNMELGEIPLLQLNEKEIRQLILNLCRNGLEAVPAGKAITIKTKVSGDNVIFAVKDQGSGISPDVVKQLGIPFFTTKDGGTGLGLVTCYSIAANIMQLLILK